MGPVTSAPNPSYRAVCSGTTGHVEVYDCVFDGNEETYEQLVRHFFMFHDPTTLNKQGNDAGTQYASVLYCYDQKQVTSSMIYYFYIVLNSHLTSQNVSCKILETYRYDFQFLF